jgi:hypothetical protein
MTTVLFRAGHRFEAPDKKSGYVLMRPLRRGDAPCASDFRPYGGAPRPVVGDQLPWWLHNQLFAHHIAKSRVL